MSKEVFQRDVSVEEIAAELYAQDKKGALHIPGFLDEELRKELLHEVRNAQCYHLAKGKYGNADQDLYLFFIGGSEGGVTFDGFPAISRLKDACSSFYGRLSEAAGFQTRGINYVSVHKFEKGSFGLTPHRDESRFVNLISVFLLDGRAPFGVCDDRAKSGAVEFDVSPGGVILLRAPRNYSEKRFRPFHYVGPVEEERYTIVFREEVLDDRQNNSQGV